MTDEIKKDKYNAEPEKKDCCGDGVREDKKGSLKVNKEKKNSNETLITILATVVVVNILVMGYFTFTVNSKLNEAIDESKPQEGKLTLVLPVNCPQCGSMSAQTKAIKDQNIELTEESTVYVNSEEGKSLVEEFGLEKLPAVVFVSEKEIKSQVLKALEKDSRKVGENSLVWEKNFSPQFDVETKKISGLVSVIYLTDKWCSECYDAPKVHKPILQNLGIAIVSEDLVDDLYGEKGQDLISKYNITSVPTVILSSEAGDYEVLDSLWSQIGTIEDDGSFVFRQMEALNATYKDLKTGKVVNEK